MQKGQGAINKIQMIFEEQFYGKYFFQVAMLLRNSLILSTLLTNTEAWPNLTSEELGTKNERQRLLEICTQEPQKFK